MKRFISRLFSLLFCFGAYALAEETEEKRTDSTGDYEYVLLEDGSTEIIRYTGTAEHLKIPAELDGYPVTSIGNEAFSNYSFLDDEFSNCDNLTSVNLPNSITSIGDNAFAWCDSLTSINLPNSITCIGRGAFRYCQRLNNISLPNSVTSIDGLTFRSCYRLNNISLPNSVTSIGDAAFSCCRSLTSINLPGSITSIAEDAFSSCPKLVLTVGPDTFAEEYAEKNRIPHIYYESTDWLNS